MHRMHRTHRTHHRSLPRSGALARLAFALSVAACAPDLGGDDGGDDGPPVVVVDNGDGSVTVTIDARDDVAWVYLDLESSALVTPVDPGDSPLWDLAALRFNIKTNGGSSGSGEVEVATIEGVPFDAVDQAPVDGYARDDAAGGPAAMEPEPGYAFDLWYDYDMDEHTLSPRDVVYVVRTVEANYYKIQMLDYYNDAGTAGYVKLRAAPIAAP